MMRLVKIIVLNLAIVFFIQAHPGIIQAETQTGEETEQISFTGKVVDTDGQPVEGAKVELYIRTSGAIPRLYDVESQEMTTKSDGLFSFNAGAKSDLYRYGSIVARKPGLALDCVSWRMRNDEECELTLGPSKNLVGLVVDENEVPVPDAEVSIFTLLIGNIQQDRGLNMNVTPLLFSVNTDREGKFVFNDLPDETTVELLVKKPGRASVCTFNPAAFGGQSLRFSVGQTDIKLTQPLEAKIEGLVIDKETAKPISSVKLMIMQDVNRPLFGHETVISKADGTFDINALTAGTYFLKHVAPTKELAEWVAEPFSVTVEEGQTKKDITIELCKGGFLEVRITEDKTGKSLEEARVGMRGEKNNQWLSAVSDENGIARIRLLPGVYQLQGVHKQGYTSNRNSETVIIEEGKTKQIAQTLSESPNIRGIVRDSDGKPLEGTELRILPGGIDPVKSDSDGKFEIIWRRSGWRSEDTIFCVVARHQQHNLAKVVEFGESSPALDIIMKPSLTLVGKVVDPDGKGISAAKIVPMLRVSNWGSTLTRDQIETDENGNYQLNAIPAGCKYKITASADGYGQQSTRIETDNAKEGRLEVETFTLPMANLSVSGQIVDIHGNPIPDARIESSGNEGQPLRLSTVADEQGKFVLDGVCAGQINIRVNANLDGKNLSARIVTDGGMTDMEIVVREGRSPVQYINSKTYEQIIKNAEKVIAGVAVDENGSPVSGVPVGVCCQKKKREDGKTSWHYSSFTTLKDITDEQGRFAIELEEDGEYNLRISPDNHAAMIVYEIPIGKKDLNIKLSKGGTITGCLLKLENGKKVPIPNAQVRIEQTVRAAFSHLGFDRDRTTKTDEQGKFRFEHIRTQIRSDHTKSEFVPRVWKISHGDTSETIAFYDGPVIEDFQLIIKPTLEEVSSLTGKPLPGFDGITIDLTSEQVKDKPVLVCFCDMNQRPSRHCIKQLIEQAEQLKEQKGITLAAIQASEIQQDKLDEWIKEYGISFPVGVVQDDGQAVRLKWAVKALPWLVLTDKEHVVTAEGFSLDELNDMLEKP